MISDNVTIIIEDLLANTTPFNPENPIIFLRGIFSVCQFCLIIFAQYRDKNILIQYLEWLSIKLTMDNPSKLRNIIHPHRSSYTFCPNGHKCTNYYSKKNICPNDHFVYMQLYTDIKSLLMYIQGPEIVDHSQIIRSLKTFCYVSRHMYEELNNRKID
jgi:hypothetical protein